MKTPRLIKKNGLWILFDDVLNDNAGNHIGSVFSRPENASIQHMKEQRANYQWAYDRNQQANQDGLLSDYAKAIWLGSYGRFLLKEIRQLDEWIDKKEKHQRRLQWLKNLFRLGKEEKQSTD